MTSPAHTLAHRIADAALSKKASDVKILDLREISNVTDFFVVVSGDASIHIEAIADGIEEELRKEGVRPSVKEGHGSGRWILLDYFDVVAHIFHAPVREFYSLEKLWGDAPLETVETH